MKTARRVSALLALLMFLSVVFSAAAWAEANPLYSETRVPVYTQDNGTEKRAFLGHIVNINGKTYVTGFNPTKSKTLYIKNNEDTYPLTQMSLCLYSIDVRFSNARAVAPIKSGDIIYINYTIEEEELVYTNRIRARVGNFLQEEEAGALYELEPTENFTGTPEFYYTPFAFSLNDEMAGIVVEDEGSFSLLIPWSAMTASGGSTTPATPAPATPAPATPAPATPAPATPAPATPAPATPKPGTGGISLPTPSPEPNDPDMNWELILIIAGSCVAVLVLVLVLVLALRKKKPAAPPIPDNDGTLPFSQPSPAPAWEPDKPIEPAAPKALALVCHGGYQDGRVYPVKSRMRIGRREVNDIKYPDTYPGVSRDHAILTYEHGVLTLTDLSSRGTYLIRAGEQRASKLANREPTVLHPGDKFYLAEKQNEFVVVTQ